MILSFCYTINKREMKMRLYEDDDETSVIDLNNAVNRRRYNKTFIFIEIEHV